MYMQTGITDVDAVGWCSPASNTISAYTGTVDGLHLPETQTPMGSAVNHTGDSQPVLPDRYWISEDATLYTVW